MLVEFGAFLSFTQEAALATISYQNCPQYYSLNDYLNNHCAFTGAWPKSPNSYLFLNVYYEPGIPSNVLSDLQQGLQSWNNSSANVYLTIVSSYNQANIRLYPTDPPSVYKENFGTQSDCSGAWGVTTDQWHIYLNYHYWDSSHIGNSNCNIAGWIATGAHELGHAMGLDHNYYQNGSGYNQLMNGCSGYSCRGLVYSPQEVDTYIFNLKYPYKCSAPPCPSIAQSKVLPGEDTASLAVPNPYRATILITPTP